MLQCSYFSFAPSASLAYSMTLLMVITPSVTRSTPSISAMGGTSGSSNLRLAFSGLCKYSAAMEEVVPPQTMCLPSFEKKSDIMRSQSSRLRGGPKRIFIGSRRRTRMTQAVASSPGFSSYSLLHSSTKSVAMVLAVYPTGAKVFINSAISSVFQPKLYERPMPACGQPSLMAIKISPSCSLMTDL